MLEYLRNASEKPIAKVLIWLLSFSFVGWGVAEWIFGSTNTDTSLVNVGKNSVSIQQFNAQKSNDLAAMTREQQRAIYTDATAQNAFNQDVLKKITINQLVENRADDLGYVVTDKRIAQTIRETPEFQVNGEFSTLAFDRLLSNSGMDEADFANALRAQTLRSMVLSPVAQQIKVPAFVTQATYNARYGQREIKYATVKYSDFNVATPTDDQLQMYYQQNPQTVPETRAVSYVFVETDMAQPDKYDAGYATAIKIEDDIIAGETMQDAAKKHGAKYVAINAFAQTEKPADKQLTDIMIAKIFDMDEGLESEMIETKDGFLFLRVDKINPSHTAEFATVKNSLISDWKKSEQKKQAYVRANELLVDLNQGTELKGKKTATVSRTSGAPVEVLTAAFRNDTEKNTIVPGADAFYVLSVTRSIAPALDTKKMADLQNEMQSTMDKSIADDYDSYLKREYPIEINEKIYNRVFGN